MVATSDEPCDIRLDARVAWKDHGASAVFDKDNVPCNGVSNMPESWDMCEVFCKMNGDDLRMQKFSTPTLPLILSRNKLEGLPETRGKKKVENARKLFTASRPPRIECVPPDCQ